MIFRVSETGLATSGLKTIISGHLACYTDKKKMFTFLQEKKILGQNKQKVTLFQIYEIWCVKTSLLSLIQIFLYQYHWNWTVYMSSLHAIRAVCGCPHRLTTGLQLVMLCCLFQARLFCQIERKNRECGIKLTKMEKKQKKSVIVGLPKWLN